MNSTAPASSPVIVACLSLGSGGMELDAVKLARLLAAEREVILLCRQGSFIQSAAGHPGASRIAVEPVKMRGKGFSPNLVRATRRMIDARGVRNVIFFGASELKSLFFAFLGRDVNVIVRHGTTKGRPKRDAFHRWIYSCVTHHVAISRYLATNVQRIVPGCCDKAPLRVIYPSFALPAPQPRARSNSLTLLHVGRFAPGKGQLEAVAACARLHAAGIAFRLRFVGGISDQAYYARVCEAMRAAAAPTAYEAVGHVDRVWDYYANADILLFPSRGEGFGNVVGEALTAGLVTVAYANTALLELPGHGFTLHLVPDGDVNALGDALVEVCRHLPQEKQRARANIPIAQRLYDPRRELEQWRELLI